MKHVKKSVLLCYSTHEMYSLVTAVKDYPRFLPWCAEAEVLEQTEQGMTARLTLAFSGVRYAFTTHNRHVEDSSVHMGLVDGPFSRLDGHWRFLPLGSQKGAPQQACKTELDLRYAIANGALAAVVSPVFDRVANTMVDSFIRRAEQVYGPR
jgi:ribosome-associated toxin RatA of RatAB toxin-antitoxin module